MQGEVVILDLEWTAWEGSLAREWAEPWEFREVIAIGALRVDAAGFQTREELEAFVRPVRNPSLSDYIVRLTGITDAFLSQHGVSFADGLARLVEFAAQAPIFSNGADGAVLRENCLLNAIPFPFDEGRLRSLRPSLALVTRLPAADLVSADLPALLGFDVPSDRHGALADAKAIARSLAWLRERGRI